MATRGVREMAFAGLRRRDVESAGRRLSRWLRPTPTRWCPRLDGWLKLENEQVTGSYKLRGALHAMAIAGASGDRRDVIAASAGNHGLGVAWAAKRLGRAATIVMPATAARTKIERAAALGARVVLHGECFDEALSHAQVVGESQGLRFVPAFDDPGVICGQGTVGLELRALAPDAVLVPIGGGGLAAGIALALAGSGTRVIGVQVAGHDAMARWLAGTTPPHDPPHTIADGVRVRVPGLLTRRLCAKLLDEIVIVDEQELRRSVARLYHTEGVVAEGAGALAAAALAKVGGACKVAIVSGGNIDASLLASVLHELGDAPPIARRVGGMS